MGIELAIVDEQQVVNRNRVFLIRLEITQAVTKNDAAATSYQVGIEYRMYGVDSEETRHFKPELQEVHFDDYVAHAMEQLSKGDPRHVGALQAIENAVAAMVASELSTTAITF